VTERLASWTNVFAAAWRDLDLTCISTVGVDLLRDKTRLSATTSLYEAPRCYFINIITWSLRQQPPLRTTTCSALAAAAFITTTSVQRDCVPLILHYRPPTWRIAGSETQISKAVAVRENRVQADLPSHTQNVEAPVSHPATE
jgi:hypothetical protein